MNQQDANSDLFESDPEKHLNWQTHTAVRNAVQDVAKETMARPDVKSFMSRFQQKKFPDYGKKTYDGCLKDASIFAVYERGFQLLRGGEAVEGEPGFVETELEPHQVKILVARIAANDYTTYGLLQRDLQYLKMIPESTKG